MKKKKAMNFNAHGDKICGIVANISNSICQVLSEQQLITCVISSSLFSQRGSILVGDKVIVSALGGEQYKLTQVMPRRNILMRGDRRTKGQEIPVAANVDYLLAVVTADYMVHQAGFIESALIAARRAGIKLAVFVSKVDLCGEKAQELIKEKLANYQQLADIICMGSAHSEHDALINKLRDKATVVMGDRGSGKTSLIYSTLSLKQDGVKLPSTHATTLYKSHDTAFIDTPGIRDFALLNVTPEERNYVLPDIIELSEQCQFRNCTHIHEAGCKILAALRAGTLRRERYDVYQTILGAKPKKTDKESRQAINYRHEPCQESFYCKKCGSLVTPHGAGTEHRNHCPNCLASVHVDNHPGDRASLCQGLMEPVSVWVRKGGEWAIIHRCKECGALSSNRIAADDNPIALMSLAVRPLSMPPFPLHTLASQE